MAASIAGGTAQAGLVGGFLGGLGYVRDRKEEKRQRGRQDAADARTNTEFGLKVEQAEYDKSRRGAKERSDSDAAIARDYANRQQKLITESMEALSGAKQANDVDRLTGESMKLRRANMALQVQSLADDPSGRTMAELVNNDPSNGIGDVENGEAVAAYAEIIEKDGKRMATLFDAEGDIIKNKNGREFVFDYDEALGKIADKKLGFTMNAGGDVLNKDTGKVKFGPDDPADGSADWRVTGNYKYNQRTGEVQNLDGSDANMPKSRGAGMKPADFDRGLKMGKDLIAEYYGGTYDSRLDKLVIPPENRENARSAISSFSALWRTDERGITPYEMANGVLNESAGFVSSDDPGTVTTPRGGLTGALFGPSERPRTPGEVAEVGAEERAGLEGKSGVIDPYSGQPAAPQTGGLQVPQAAPQAAPQAPADPQVQSGAAVQPLYDSMPAELQEAIKSGGVVQLDDGRKVRINPQTNTLEVKQP